MCPYFITKLLQRSEPKEGKTILYGEFPKGKNPALQHEAEQLAHYAGGTVQEVHHYSLDEQIQGSRDFAVITGGKTE